MRNLSRNPAQRAFWVAALAIALGGCGPAPDLDTSPRVEHWIETLEGPDAALHQEAAFKLGNLGPTDPERIVPALMAALHDPNAAVRREAILALLKCGPAASDAAPDLAEIEQNDPDHTVRGYAIKALEKLAAAE